jgi:cbb3-type cytochrome oxidase maturation protein
MDILYLLVPLSVVLVVLIGAVFWFAVRNGQFDDLDGPALKVVLDDDRSPMPETPRVIDNKYPVKPQVPMNHIKKR